MPLSAGSSRLLAGVGSLFFLLPIAGTWTGPVVPAAVKTLCAIILVITAFRPRWGLWTIAALLPLNSLIGAYINPDYEAVQQAEMLVAPFVFAASMRIACGLKAPSSRLAGPALVLGAIIAASGLVGMAGRQLATTWPLDYLRGLWAHLSVFYFDQSSPYTVFHSATPWIEGLTLLVLAERLSRGQTVAASRLIAPMALAALASWRRLVEISLRREHPILAGIEFLRTLRVTFFHSDINAAGSLLALFFVPAAWMAFSSVVAKERTPQRIRSITGYLLATVALALPLYWTVSRAAWAGAAAGLVVIWIYSRRPSWRIFAVVAGGAATVMATVVLMNPRVETQSSSSVATRIRWEMGKIALQMTGEQPVFGIGLGEFRASSRRFVSDDLLKMFPATAVGENAHNNFLQILAELGIAGLAAFLWMLAVAAASVRGANNAGAPRPAQVALAGGVLAFLISCLGGHPFLTTEVLWLFLLTLGAMTAMAVRPTYSRRWLAPVLALIVVASIPVRVWQLHHDETRRRVVGAGPPSDVDTDRIYRPAGPRSSWPVPSDARAVEIPLQITRDSRPPCLVRVTVDGAPANVVDVRADVWTPVLLPFDPRPAGSLSRLVGLRVEGAECHLKVGTFTIRK